MIKASVMKEFKNSHFNFEMMSLEKNFKFIIHLQEIFYNGFDGFNQSLKSRIVGDNIMYPLLFTFAPLYLMTSFWCLYCYL